jgi:hypothetical protein
VQLGHDDLGRGHTLFRVNIDRNSTPVIDHRDRIIFVDDDVDFGGVSGQSLVNRVIDDFVHQVMQTGLAGRTDVHRRAQPHCFQAFEHLDAARIVNRARIFGGHVSLILN